MSLDPANQLRIEEIRAAVAEICGHDVTPIEAVCRLLPLSVEVSDGTSRAVRDIKKGEFVRFPGDRVTYTREHYIPSERRFCLSRVDGTGDRFVNAEKLLIVGFTY